MRSKWETYQGKTYFSADYARMTPAEFAQESKEAAAEVLKHPNSSVRTLINVEGLLISPRELDIFKQMSIQVKSVTAKSAVLGVTGAKKVLLDMMIAFSGMTLKAFDQREAALKWLVE